MIKIRNYLKNNIKVFIALIVGIIISGIVVYAEETNYSYSSNNVSFVNTNTNLKLDGNSVNNVQDALDALNEKINSASSGPSCAFE